MSSNISLYTVTAALVLGNEGKRLFAKYYRIGDQIQQYKTLQEQTAFEEAVYGKINKQHQDIILYDNHLVTYKQSNDVIVVIVAAINENESMIYLLTSNISEALSILLNNSLDTTTLLKNYDMVCLCFDEAIDDGIVVEIDPAIIVSRVTKSPTNDFNLNVNLDKGMFNALSFASKKISERLQQGL